MLGGLLALLAAATFALNSATARRAVLSGSVMQGIAITVPLGVPAFFLGALLLGQLGALWSLSWMAVVWLSLAGIAHFVWGRFFIYRAQELIGANLAGTLQQFDLIISLVLAVLVLGEVLTPLRIIGIALVIIGPALAFSGEASRTKQAVASASSVQFTPRHVEGYTFVALSSIGYGLSPIFTSLGLRELGGGASMVGGLVAYLAATVAVAVLVVGSGSVRHVAQTNAQAWRWFGFAGLSVSVSQMLRFAALSLAPVTVVQPIQRLSKLFLFLFSWLMNREHEVFNPRLLLAAVVSVIGAVLLSISADAFLAIAPWPEWLVRAARWQWP
jgi:drug/metabolite transporter (DMT)-like permease